MKTRKYNYHQSYALIATYEEITGISKKFSDAEYQLLKKHSAVVDGEIVFLNFEKLQKELENLSNQCPN